MKQTFCVESILVRSLANIQQKWWISCANVNVARGAKVSGLSVRQADCWDQLQYNTYYNVDGWSVVSKGKRHFGIHSFKCSY